MLPETPDFTGHADKVRQVFKTYSSYDDATGHKNASKAPTEIEELISSIGAQVTQHTPFEAK